MVEGGDGGDGRGGGGEGEGSKGRRGGFADPSTRRRGHEGGASQTLKPPLKPSLKPPLREGSWTLPG